jgi:hypothetical protein
MQAPRERRAKPVSMGQNGNPAPQVEATEAAAPRAVPWTTVIVGAVSALGCNYWLIHMNSVSFNALPTTISVFFHVVFILFLLALINAALRRWAPRLALSARSLSLFYSMLCIASVPAGLDGTLILSAIVGTPSRLATPENRWGELFVDQIPSWLIVRDSSAVRGFFEGSSSLWVLEHLAAWLGTGFWWPKEMGPTIGPFIAWGAFLFVLWLGTQSLACLFRRRWDESERLSFPVVQLPLELSQNPGKLLSQRVLWVGFAIALAIDLSNGLKSINPLFPAIPVSGTHPAYNLSTRIVDAPYNAVSFLPISFYPLVIGLSLLLPTELVFSCVFFLFFWKAIVVLSAATGTSAIPRAPWIEEQNFGGYIGLALFSLWASRTYLARAFRAVVHPQPDEGREPLRYRTALLVFVACFLGVVTFTRLAGMSTGLAVLFFLAYYLISLAIGRIRAELGLPVHDLHFSGPGNMLINVVGSRALGPTNTIVAAMYWGFNRAYRNHPMPHQSEALHLAGRTGSDQRRVLIGLVVALAVGCASAMPLYARACYIYGGMAKMPPHVIWRGDEIYSKLAGWVDRPTPFDARSLLGIVVGTVFIIVGMALKTRFLWWPLHPIGYAVSGTWSMQLLWCPMLIAWAIKTVVTRYGGHTSMKRLVPIALGLMLGDITGGCFWALLGMVNNKTYYMIWE